MSTESEPVPEPAEAAERQRRRARIAEDMQALHSLEARYAGTEGERRMLNAIRARIDTDVPSQVEGFVAHTEPARSVMVHGAVIALAGLVAVWFPFWGGLVAALFTVSLIGEGLRRFSLLQWWRLKSASYNLVVRQEADELVGCVVIATPLDVPRWVSRGDRRLRWLRPQRFLVLACLAVSGIAMLRSIGMPLPDPVSLQIGALGGLVFALLLGRLTFRRSDGTSTASGSATLLELIRRFEAAPPPGIEVWTAFTGCGRAYQTGMKEFLRLHGRSLKDPVLVVALDRPGSLPLAGVVAEGPLVTRWHRPTGPGLVERLRWAGVVLPTTVRYGATDAYVALDLGYRALALKGGRGPANPQAVLRSADIIETLVRWYAGDVARVQTNRPELERLGRELAQPAQRRRRRGLRAVPAAQETEPVADEPDHPPDVQADAGDPDGERVP